MPRQGTSRPLQRALPPPLQLWRRRRPPQGQCPAGTRPQPLPQTRPPTTRLLLVVLLVVVVVVVVVVVLVRAALELPPSEMAPVLPGSRQVVEDP